MNKMLFAIYFLLWLALSFVAILYGRQFFINSQIAFFSAIFISFASFLSYKKKVLKKLKQKQEQTKTQDEENLEDITLKSEKQRLKAQKTKLKDLNLGTAFVPFRLFAYAFLIAGFVFLKNNGLFMVSAYLIGLSAMPVGTMIFAFFTAREKF